MDISKPSGFLAVPDGGNNGAGVLVLHAWWGLNDTIMAFCQRLADAGYVAFAPDYYDGKVTENIEGAEELSTALDFGLAKECIMKAALFLATHPACSAKSIAVIGFSLGAFFALELSNSMPDLIHKVVVFYGTNPCEFGSAKAAYQGHFAEDDVYEPKYAVESLEKSIREAGRDVNFYFYKSCSHWFFESDRISAYNQNAAELAWQRTLVFLKTHME